MLSGGIDSPVAGYLAMKRGIVIDAVYFEAIPHTSLEAREKVITLCRKLSSYTNHINLHIVNFTPIQEEIYKNCREDYCITIMRRMMYRIMEKLATKYNGLAIINGESVGQVASQTLTSMSVINSVTNMPVIRPLACLDKLEIMDIARKIDTYETRPFISVPRPFIASFKLLEVIVAPSWEVDKALVWILNPVVLIDAFMFSTETPAVIAAPVCSALLKLERDMMESFSCSDNPSKISL